MMVEITNYQLMWCTFKVNTQIIKWNNAQFFIVGDFSCASKATDSKIFLFWDNKILKWVREEIEMGGVG